MKQLALLTFSLLLPSSFALPTAFPTNLISSTPTEDGYIICFRDSTGEIEECYIVKPGENILPVTFEEPGPVIITSDDK